MGCFAGPGSSVIFSKGSSTPVKTQHTYCAYKTAYVFLAVDSLMRNLKQDV